MLWHWWPRCGRAVAATRTMIEGSGGLVIVMLIPFALPSILAPLWRPWVQLAISRQRGVLTDASSVELTRNPQGMINALLKLDNNEPIQQHVDDVSSALYQRSQKRIRIAKGFFYTHPSLLSGWLA